MHFYKAKKYGEKAREYLAERERNGEAAAKNETPAPSKEKAVTDAKKLGYLKAAADLVADRPDWTVREMTIDRVELGGDLRGVGGRGRGNSGCPKARRPARFRIFRSHPACQGRAARNRRRRSCTRNRQREIQAVPAARSSRQPTDSRRRRATREKTMS